MIDEQRSNRPHEDNCGRTGKAGCASCKLDCACWCHKTFDEQRVKEVWPDADVKEYRISRSTTAYRIVRKAGAAWKRLSNIRETPEKSWADAASRLPKAEVRSESIFLHHENPPCPTCGATLRHLRGFVDNKIVCWDSWHEKGEAAPSLKQKLQAADSQIRDLKASSPLPEGATELGANPIADIKEVQPCAMCGRSWMLSVVERCPIHFCKTLGANLTVGWSQVKRKPVTPPVEEGEVTAQTFEEWWDEEIRLAQIHIRKNKYWVAKGIAEKAWIAAKSSFPAVAGGEKEKDRWKGLGPDDDGSLIWAARYVLQCAEAWTGSFERDKGMQSSLKLLRERIPQPLIKDVRGKE